MDKKKIDPHTDTIRFGPRKVYKCATENKTMERHHTRKNSNGIRICKSCGSVVQDVTNTETGQSFIQVLGL